MTWKWGVKVRVGVKGIFDPSGTADGEMLPRVVIQDTILRHASEGSLWGSV